MPGPVLKTRLTTRGYELGPYGVVPVSTLLRYLEHQRWQTLTQEGELPMRRFWALGVVRAQHLELFDTVSFHVELELSLWVSRVGRSSLDFSHDVTRVEDQALVARSTATIVALDSSRAPAPIDPRAREYVVERTVARFERPTGTPPADAWHHPVHLRPSDHDLQQHVNHARYADLIDDTRLLCDASGGYGNGFDARRRVGMFSIQYDQEARAGEALLGRTWRIADAPDDIEVELVKDDGVTTTRARIGFAAR